MNKSFCVCVLKVCCEVTFNTVNTGFGYMSSQLSVNSYMNLRTIVIIGMSHYFKFYACWWKFAMKMWKWIPCWHHSSFFGEKCWKLHAKHGNSYIFWVSMLKYVCRKVEVTCHTVKKGYVVYLLWKLANKYRQKSLFWMWLKLAVEMWKLIYEWNINSEFRLVHRKLTAEM